ncbi:G-protein coupled receptor 1 [Trichoplax sp. H2]|nr:G-protein coupled receptor 1 [Trichoplax sp. H2]|eukprot:RDD39780.1 G-protein coupled receptor 1 [Trichoplax sp. H2]
MTSMNCTLFQGDQSKCSTIVIVKRILASISIVGSFAMIFLIWLFNKHQFFAQRLLLFLSIAALLDSVSYVMGDIQEAGPLCTFEAVMLSIFDWAVLLWITIITFNLYWNAVAKKSTERFEIYYHLVAWGVPVVISVLPFIGNQYGPAGAW